jgi:hypothetical protein
VCRRLYHSTRAAFLPLGPKAMVPEVGREGGREGRKKRRKDLPSKISFLCPAERTFTSVLLPSLPPSLPP